MGCLDGECRSHLLDMSCSVDFLANSAHEIDGVQLSRVARQQCRQNVLGTGGTRTIWINVRMTLPGGLFPETK